MTKMHIKGEISEDKEDELVYSLERVGNQISVLCENLTTGVWAYLISFNADGTFNRDEYVRVSGIRTDDFDKIIEAK